MIMHHLRTVVRSAGVGAVATLTDLVALTILVELSRLPIRCASVVALGVGIAVQFFGNKLFAFDDRSSRWLSQGAQFLGVEVLGFTSNLVLYDVAVHNTRLPYLPLRLLTTFVVYLCVCLPLWSRIFHSELGDFAADGGVPGR